MLAACTLNPCLRVLSIIDRTGPASCGGQAAATTIPGGKTSPCQLRPPSIGLMQVDSLLEDAGERVLTARQASGKAPLMLWWCMWKQAHAGLVLADGGQDGNFQRLGVGFRPEDFRD